MELGSVIIGLVSLACFILPIIYLQNAKKKEKKKFLKEYMLLAEQQQLTISQCDFWNHGYAIGIDPLKNKLFYLKKLEGKEQKITIDLSEIASCRIININKTEKDYKIVERIQLAFTFRNLRKAEMTLDFFDKEESMTIHDEHQLSEKWNTFINEHLKVQSKSRTNVGSGSNNLKAA